jgi:protein-S-isoprenylcysteine O-methyltransferase Ste14
MPIVIMGSAIFFNLVNGSILGGWLGSYAAYPSDWLTGPAFWGGMALFLMGAAINIWSDEILLRLRKPGETGYKIPQGGLFRWVSCPNLLGEMVEWAGFALMGWNVATLSFAVWTAANLLPRALDHHRWYLEKFPEYPKERKAVIPGVW